MEKRAKKGRKKEAEGRKRRKGGNANRQSGIGRRPGAGRKGGSGAKRSSSSSIRVGVGKGRSQMLYVDRLKATNAKRQRCMSTPNEPHDSGFGNGITNGRKKDQRDIGRE